MMNYFLTHKNTRFYLIFIDLKEHIPSVIDINSLKLSTLTK